MKLLTEVGLPEYPFRLGHRDPLLLMGSCFTEHTGKLLERYLFHARVNPFGVTYNPVSVLRQLKALLEKERYNTEELGQHDGMWFSFDHDTWFSSPDRDLCLDKINAAFLETKQALIRSTVLVITWGTAWVYREREDGNVVCNCHKIPAARFVRSRLTPDEIVGAYGDFLPTLLQDKRELKVILTVSPVRHWKDGAHGNQLSKAALLLATESLRAMFPERVFYFPSYEIVMDELRDYRFYAADMLHVNSQAFGYIWEKFIKVLVSDESMKVMDDLEPLLKITEHRPRELTGNAFMELGKKRESICSTLRQKYPFLAWENLEISL
jgi:hypothetical protein